ncbi:MAG TPA: amidase family protein [Paracoccaceae bacterium]|nr:amidase family protein [Paracoccaceae bacterium]
MEFWKMPGHEVARLVREGQATAREVTTSAMARLAAVNPSINAVVQEFPDEALAEADRVDARRSAGDDSGPLAGVPVTVKVNVDQTGHATTNGVRIQKDLIAAQDNPVVANLRKAGAVIVGRTNTPAFSLRWFCRNSLHGATKNPRDAALTPGGSSGGAASATAAGIGAIGHGTDIAGSIRYPAYACGIHGLRPTLGRIPAINFSGPDRMLGAQIMAVSGPIARTVEDLGLGFQAMCAEDVRDPWWVPVPHRLGGYPKRAALCVRPEGLNTAPEVEKALRDAAAVLTDAGWEVVETDMPPIREPARMDILLWLAEMRRSGGEMVVREDDPDANHVFRMLSEVVEAPDANGLLDATQKRAALLREWQVFLREHPVLLCPVSAELPFPDALDIESDESFRRCFEAQIIQIGLPFMGLPGLTLTTGLVGRSPVGVQLVAGRYREDILLDAAAVIEDAGTPASPVDPA